MNCVRVLFVDHPLQPKTRISFVSALRIIAAQEGCDGEPYDQLVAAADRIDELEEALCDREPVTVTDEHRKQSGVDFDCPNCGETISPRYKFCWNCGAPLIWENMT